MFARVRPLAVAGLTIAGLATSFAGVGGQEGAGPVGQPAAQVLRSGATAVLVDVYPQRNGRIVPGLTAADFQVFEDGTPQRIETVEFVRIEPAAPDAARRDPNSTREMYALVADPRRRVFVAFLDEFHTTTAGSNLVRRPLLDMIDRAVGADDLIGIMTARLRPEDVTFGRERLAIEDQLTRYWTRGASANASRRTVRTRWRRRSGSAITNDAPSPAAASGSSTTAASNARSTRS